MTKLAALRWAPARAGSSGVPRFAAYRADEIAPVSGGLIYWDAWPLLDTDGSLYDDGHQLWFALAAPRSDDPNERHDRARIHLLHRRGDRFDPLGLAMPDRFSPGSREWSGSASFNRRTGRVRLLFTAAGRRGEPAPTFEQRLFRATATLIDGALADWSAPEEILVADLRIYRRANQSTGSIGTIKAFRDPDIFRDPATDQQWLMFTGSSATRPGDHDGLIGLARIDADFVAHAERPLVDATGFNNELERPHMRLFDGRYHLFWSTQAQVFAPGAGDWPTGLYGAVADRIDGPWRLLNRTGLVAANPIDEPTQAYSWLVLPDASVTSFVDHWGRSTGAGQFGGTFAPFEKLILDGDAARLAPR